jgi:transcriptional regulator with XRE-family HTH domain
MPKTFKDLEEACAYWDLVSRRSMHFVCEYRPDSHRGLNPYFDYESGELVSLTKVISDTNENTVDDPLGKEFLDRYQCDRKKYSDDIARWSAAFSDLYSRLKRTTNKRQIMGAHTLCVKSKSMEMGVGSAIEDGMCSHDKYFSHFREIVTLSKEIIRIKKTLSQSEFAVELGIIPSLHMAAKWCRGRTIRREAIALLYEYGSREGHWDSKRMAEIDSCVMELEEEDIDTEYIPEFARVRVLSITSDEEGGDWATVEYVRGSPRTGELPGRKRIRSPVDQQAISGRGSEESETSVAPYGEALMFSYDSADNGKGAGYSEAQVQRL